MDSVDVTPVFLQCSCDKGSWDTRHSVCSIFFFCFSLSVFDAVICPTIFSCTHASFPLLDPCFSFSFLESHTVPSDHFLIFVAPPPQKIVAPPHQGTPASYFRLKASWAADSASPLMAASDSLPSFLSHWLCFFQIHHYTSSDQCKKRRLKAAKSPLINSFSCKYSI